MRAPELRLVLTVGFDPSGYFLGGFNLFELYDIDHLLLYGKDLYVPTAAAFSIEIVPFLYL